MNRSTTVRDATLALLRGFGINTIFGNPGSTELPLFRNFPDDFRYILGLQESVALGIADGFAQATRNAAVVNLHSTGGTGHALGSLYTAFRNQTPLIVTAGQQARSILPFDPFLFADRPTEFPQPFVKWACEPARAEDVPRAIARAYYMAMQPPCGPTFVSVPVDDWDQPCGTIEPRRVSGVNSGDPVLLREASELLSASSRPAFVLGAGIGRDQAWYEMIALAERHSAAVWEAPMTARANFPQDHALFKGFLPAAREVIVKSLAGHDLILVIGGPLSVYHVEGTGPHIPEGAGLIQIVDNHSQAAWAPEGMAIIANARHAVRALLAGPEPVARNAPEPRVRAPALDGDALTSAYVMQQLARLRPAGSVIVAEAPTAIAPMQSHLPTLTPDGFYSPASGVLGHGLPAAVGLALGRPGEKVIAVLGDGSSMYSIQGLWTAAQLGLPISFIILNNQRYEALEGFGRHFGMQETVGTRLPGLDFCALAQGQGVPGKRVKDPRELDEAIVASLNADRPTLVEVLVD